MQYTSFVLNDCDKVLSIQVFQSGNMTKINYLEKWRQAVKMLYYHILSRYDEKVVFLTT